MRTALWRRARVVWLCQVGMLIFLFTLIAHVGLRADRQAIKNLLSFYLAQPLDALWAGLLMAYNPPLLDILPMYFLFMLASPLALSLGLRRNGWSLVIVGSVVLWMLAQFGLNHSLYSTIAIATHWKVPLHQTGAFQLFAWQLLWIVGMWIGSREQTASRPLAFPPWVIAAAVSFAVICIAWRHAVGQAPFGPHAPLNWLFGKWDLGPLRLANFFTLMVVLVRFGPSLAARLPLGPLQTLGRASLPVFCAHVIVSLLVLAAIGDSVGKTPLWAETVLLAAVLTSLYGVALVTNRLGRRKAGQPITENLKSLSPGMAG